MSDEFNNNQSGEHMESSNSDNGNSEIRNQNSYSENSNSDNLNQNNNPYSSNSDNMNQNNNPYSDNSDNMNQNINPYSNNSDNVNQNNNSYGGYSDNVNQNSNQYGGYVNNMNQNSNPYGGYSENMNQNNNPNNGYTDNVSQNNNPYPGYSDSRNQNNSQSYYNGSTGSYNNSYTNMNQNDNPSRTIYPAPQVNEDKKPKKRKYGVFKLTAAGLVFGLIAGAAFQGYYMAMSITGNIKTASSNNDAKVTEVAESSDNKDTVVPASSTSSDSIVTDVSDVVQKVMPAIVAINCKATTTDYDLFGREYSQESQGSGSGIIIGQNSSQLLIVTNNHVTNGATSVQVVFSNNKTASAEIKNSDANADLAILTVKMSDLSAETLKSIKVARLGDSTKIEAGDMAIAIGNALGYGQSVTVGYISAVNREVTVENKTMKLLQTDAAINPGNSGGALINIKGEVIGINSSKYASTEVEGMGYAIPISTALPMINQLISRQAVSADKQGYLGINATTAQNVTSDYAERFNMPVGIYVNDIIKDSPADKAGLKQGNIITGIDDVTISTIDDLVNALSYKKAGDTINLKIQIKSSGKYVEKALKVTLGSKK